MTRFVWQWFVVSSALVTSLALNAETRPQYGGTLRVATHEALMSLDPVDSAQPDSFARRNVMLLMFDTLVTIDANGDAQPSLAMSWHVNSGRWQFQLRRGVKFHDGTAFTVEIAIASLRAANPSWNVSGEGDSVIIESNESDARLLAELALPRNAIANRIVGAKPSGTGPFHIVDWQPGKKLTLVAEENCWRGRPYLDGVEIEMGKSYRDQMMSLDLGKTDLVEIPAEQTHRASLEGRSLISSLPVDLIALVFANDAKSPEEKSLREALALSVERSSIRSVLLQGAGQSAGGILPNWMSGYGFVFSTSADLARARHIREQVHTIPAWTLGYDSNDSAARLLAERIALNAKDAGLSLQATSSTSADLRLVWIPLTSANPWIALANVNTLTGTSAVKNTNGLVEDLYAAEQAMLSAQRIIPLFHLPMSYASASSLKNWNLRPDGTWNLADAWLGARLQ